MEKTNLKKMLFKPPTLTQHGTMREISENLYKSSTQPFWSGETPMMERPTAKNRRVQTRPNKGGSGLSRDRTAKRRDEGWSRSRLILKSTQLRDCPLMSHRGTRNWPPTWNKTSGGSLAGPYETLLGEIGTLKQVILSKFDNTCHLLIEFRGMTYVGTLVLTMPRSADNYASFCKITTSANRL